MSFSKDYINLDHFSVFKSITYDKMMQLFHRLKTGVLMIGGPWCQNRQAVMGIVNHVAKKNRIHTIYCYDPHFVNVFKEIDDLRDCKDLDTKLKYYELIEKIGYRSPELVQDTLIPRLPVPAIIGVKNGDCIGIISDEYLLDDYGLHTVDSKVDHRQEYETRLTKLFQLIKPKRKHRKEKSE